MPACSGIVCRGMNNCRHEKSHGCSPCAMVTFSHVYLPLFFTVQQLLMFQTAYKVCSLLPICCRARTTASAVLPTLWHAARLVAQGMPRVVPPAPTRAAHGGGGGKPSPPWPQPAPALLYGKHTNTQKLRELN